MVKCLPEFEYFTVFLKNKNIIFKIRRSKVTDYAALTVNIGVMRFLWLHVLLNFLVTVKTAPHLFLLKLPNSSEFSKIHLLCCGDLLLDFSLTVKAAPHECVFRTSQL